MFCRQNVVKQHGIVDVKLYQLIEEEVVYNKSCLGELETGHT